MYWETIRDGDDVEVGRKLTSLKCLGLRISLLKLLCRFLCRNLLAVCKFLRVSVRNAVWAAEVTTRSSSLSFVYLTQSTFIYVKTGLSFDWKCSISSKCTPFKVFQCVHEHAVPIVQANQQFVGRQHRDGRMNACDCLWLPPSALAQSSIHKTLCTPWHSKTSISRLKYERNPLKFYWYWCDTTWR